ncbi:MAG: hypothetical protein CL764_01605 [Chloroflexi bacterium]|nr:hypothetical protein [Chloroflexota bacterium]
MNWVLIATLSSVIYAAVSLTDKQILSKHKLDLYPFCLFAGSVNLLISLIIFLFSNIPSLQFILIIKGISVGILWGLAIWIMFSILKKREITRVELIFQSSPIFVIIMATLFLEENLSIPIIFSFILMMFGSILASIEINKQSSGLNKKDLLFLLFSAFLVGVASIVLKSNSKEIGELHALALRGVGIGITLGVPSLRISSFRKLIAYLTNIKKGPFIISTELGAALANMLIIIAITSGPVSIVQAIMGTRPVFVFIGSIILTIFGIKSFENWSKTNTLIKMISLIMVTSGLITLSLFK